MVLRAGQVLRNTRSLRIVARTTRNDRLAADSAMWRDGARRGRTRYGRRGGVRA